MQAFLRDDLWAKPYVHRAEEYTQTTDKDSLLRVQTRITFLTAALISSAQTICYVALTPIALVGHVIFSLANLVVAFDLSNRVSSCFYDSFSKLRGSLMVVVISTLSALTSTELSRSMTGWLGNQASQDWDQFKVNELRKLAERIDTVRVERQSPLKDRWDECFHLSTAYTYTKADGSQYKSTVYFDAMAHDMKMKARALITEAEQRISDPRATAAQKFERSSEAIDRIGAYISKKQRKLSQLPITYSDFVDYRLQKAEKYKGRALNFLDRQAAASADLERRRDPTKFDENQFNTDIKKYRDELGSGFDKSIEELRKKQQSFKTTWSSTVDKTQQELTNLQSRMGSYESWLKWGGLFLSDATKQQYAEDMGKLQQDIQRAKGQRANAIYSVKKGAFKSFEWHQLSFDKYFKKQVQGGGKILSNIQWYARPSFMSRLFGL